MGELKRKCTELLASCTVASFNKPHRVITLTSDISLAEGFKILLDNTICSAPVQKNGEFIGFLDIRDLVTFVVVSHDDESVHGNYQLRNIIKTGQAKMEGVQVSTEIFARRHKFCPVSLSSTILEVAKILAVPDVHRVPVVEDGRVVNIISQSSVVNFLASNLMGTIFSGSDTAIGSLNIGNSPVVSVTSTTSVIDAFRVLDQQKKSGIAIVQNGKLVGCTNGKDLGLFLANPNLSMLKLPMLEFLKQVRLRSVTEVLPYEAGNSSDKLSRLLGRFSASKIHRVIVVENGVPLKVISITDILHYLLQD